MTTQYRNPWHKPGRPEYGPEIYTTEARPTTYKGFLVYRVNRVQWDVVKDGRCITQMAGIEGAKSAIDKLHKKEARRNQ